MSRGRCFLVLPPYLRAVLSRRYLPVSGRGFVIPSRYTVAAAHGPKEEDGDVDLDLVISEAPLGAIQMWFSATSLYLRHL